MKLRRIALGSCYNRNPPVGRNICAYYFVFKFLFKKHLIPHTNHKLCSAAVIKKKAPPCRFYNRVCHSVSIGKKALSVFGIKNSVAVGKHPDIVAYGKHVLYRSSGNLYRH